MSKPSGNSFSRKRAQWRDQIFDDRELLPADKVVAYVLARFLNSETFTAYPGAMTLADAANISLRTVRSALSHFVQNGHLKITTAKGGLSILTPVLFAGDEPEPATPPEKAKPKSKPNGTGNGNGHDKAHASWPADYKEIFWRNYPRQERYASTMKALDKIERIEAPSRSKRVRFGFPPAPRSGDVVVRALGLQKAYGETKVFTGLDLLLRRGDRVALVGPNGAGKSTLLKTLAGRLAPDAGSFDLGHNVTVQYYAQHQLEALIPQDTVLETLERVAEPGSRQTLRTLLGSFLFSGADVDKRVGVLSGGEKARLALARMLIRPSNLMLLDEPTNHLDLQSREVLEEALDEYEGTLVVISHDRYFINRIATSIAEVGGGGAMLFAGDYDTFLERHVPVEAPVEVFGTTTADDADAGSRGQKREAKRAEADERNRRYREKKALEEKLRPIEEEIQRLEARDKEIESQMSNPDVYRDPERAKSLGRERAEVASRLSILYERWEALTAEPG
jgi:ABC-type multidrug transport system ATPase subunit